MFTSLGKLSFVPLVETRPPGWCREFWEVIGSLAGLDLSWFLSWDGLCVGGQVMEPLSLSFLISKLEMIAQS